MPFPSPRDLLDPRIKPTSPASPSAAAKSLQSCPTLPQTAAHQAPPSLGFSRQDYWSGLPFPSPKADSSPLHHLGRAGMSFRRAQEDVNPGYTEHLHHDDASSPCISHEKELRVTHLDSNPSHTTQWLEHSATHLNLITLDLHTHRVQSGEVTDNSGFNRTVCEKHQDYSKHSTKSS